MMDVVASSGIAFFSEKRIGKLASQLGHDRLQPLFERLVTFANAFTNSTTYPTGFDMRFNNATDYSVVVEPQNARLYIKGKTNT